MTKYKAKPTTIDGHRFASKAEARRYCHLKLRQRAGEITDLALHPVYKVEVAGEHICKYIADFEYLDAKTGDWIVEDVKGVRTPLYKLKRKLVEALHPVKIREVNAR